MKKMVSLILCIFSLQILLSQKPSNHRWENQAVVVFTNSENSEKFEAQRRELTMGMKGFEERKLVLLHSTPNKYKQYLPVDSQWTDDAGIYDQMLDKEADFEVILIGMDGGVKLRQKEILESSYLFKLLDSMPGQQVETKRKLP